MTEFIDEAESSWKLGIVSMPITDKKRPCIAAGSSWNHLKDEYVSKVTIETQKWDSAKGIGFICGKNSGGLFCVDVDLKHDEEKRVMKDLVKSLNEADLEIMKKFVIESTPSGGFHLIGRSREREQKKDNAAKNVNHEAIIEILGQGNYFATYPTAGYKLLQGDFTKIKDFSSEEMDVIVSRARELDRSVPKYSKPIPQFESDELRPGDLYNQSVSKDEFLQILVKDKWRIVKDRGQPKKFLVRPGKEGLDYSATFDSPETPGKLYIFSSSTLFPEKQGLTPFSYMAYKDFNGDFASCAKHLVNLGFEEKRVVPTKKIVINKTDTFNDIVKIMQADFKQGVSTGWPSIDPYYTIVKGQLNIVSGYPSHGKSEWVDALLVNLAIIYGWKFVYSSAENFPVWIHKRKIAEKYVGKKIWGIQKDEKMAANIADFIDKHFMFIEQSDEVNFESILAVTKEKKPDGLVIDPWNEIDAGRPNGVSETDYIGKCLKRARLFARENNICLWIVAHPAKPIRDKNESPPVPTLYDIAGSAHWFNKADNGIIVYRKNDLVEIHIQKIKFRYFGGPGTIPLYYDFTNGRYVEINSNEGRKISDASFASGMPTGDQ